MKKQLPFLLFTILLAMLQFSSLANTIVVNGHVRSAAGNPLSGRTVRIYTDSSNSVCLINHSRTTDSSGYFRDTLSCNGDIRNIKVSVLNCDGTTITNAYTAVTGTVIESNFALCTSAPPADTSHPNNPPTNCHAGFTIANTTAYIIKFNAAGSAAGAGDSIASRTWSFGDSTTSAAGTNDPSHTYTRAGTYHACLNIHTKLGCESSYCVDIVIRDTTQATPPPTNCHASFTIANTTAYIIKFNAAGSAAGAGDSIASRTWSFGDSTTPAAGTNDPSHTYTRPGTYHACLNIHTKLGCESSYCVDIVIRDTTHTTPPPTNCHASFTIANTTAYIIKFNAAGSAAGVGDSIASRTWSFGDSTTPAAGINDPSHTYTRPGTYHACLNIHTKLGCESSYCVDIVITDTTHTAPPPTNCKAMFTVAVQSFTASFNSAASSGTTASDSIVSRTWNFGDSSSVSNTTTGIAPVHTFAKAGTYQVTLVIKTKLGCESRTTIAVTIISATNECVLMLQVSTEKTGNRQFRFNSSLSNTQRGDSIVHRTWKFGDGTSLEGNEISPTKAYKDTGIYNVCVTMTTSRGCEKQYCFVVGVRDSVPPPPAPVTGCNAGFSFTVQALSAAFNSSASVPAGNDDSIVLRSWKFGDSTAVVTGNNITALHSFVKAGAYRVTLTIKTKKGCESSYTETVTVVAAPFQCAVQVVFTADRVGPKKISLNSSSSTAQNDSIISRRWKFGDGTTLETSAAVTSKEFPLQGIYNVCLELTTQHGCTTEACKQVNVQDSTTVNPVAGNQVTIVSINPNPVTTKMVTTVASKGNNIEAVFTIYDLYGAPKLSFKKVLGLGNNAIETITANLKSGFYFIVVTAPGSRDSRIFYKF